MRICWLLLPICLASAWPVAAATGIDPCPQPLLLRFSGLPAQPPALDEVVSCGNDSARSLLQQRD